MEGIRQLISRKVLTDDIGFSLGNVLPKYPVVGKEISSKKDSQ